MSEPKKETVRIAFPQSPEAISRRQELPKPVGLTLTQPGPATSPLPSTVASGNFARFSVPAVAQNEVTSSAIDAFDSIPRWFCWGLLGLSALIFLIQIWNYALS